MHAIVGFSFKKDLSYSSASTIKLSNPVLTKFEHSFLKKPPINDVKD